MIAKFMMGDYDYDYNRKTFVDKRDGEEVFPYISGYNADPDKQYYNPKTKFKSAETRDKAMREQEDYEYKLMMENTYHDKWERYYAESIYNPNEKDKFIDNLDKNMAFITDKRVEAGIKAYAAKDLVPYFKKYVQDMIEDRDYTELQKVLNVKFNMSNVESEVRSVITKELQNLITLFADKSVAQLFLINIMPQRDYEELFKMCYEQTLVDDKNASYAFDLIEKLRNINGYEDGAVDTSGIRKLNWWIETAPNNYLTETSVRDVMKKIFTTDDAMPYFQIFMIYSEEVKNILFNLKRLQVID